MHKSDDTAPPYQSTQRRKFGLLPVYAKRQLASGELALGLALRQARTVDFAMIGKSCGFDWLFIDMEHGSLDLDSYAAALQARGQ